MLVDVERCSGRAVDAQGRVFEGGMPRPHEGRQQLGQMLIDTLLSSMWKLLYSASYRFLKLRRYRLAGQRTFLF